MNCNANHSVKELVLKARQALARAQSHANYAMQAGMPDEEHLYVTAGYEFRQAREWYAVYDNLRRSIRSLIGQ